MWEGIHNSFPHDVERDLAMADEQPDQTQAVAELNRPLDITLQMPKDRPPVSVYFDPTTPDGAVMLVKGSLHKLPSIKEVLNKEIRIVSSMDHDATTVDSNTGEVKDFRRTIIFLEDGTAYDCGAQGVDKALRILRAVAGNPPWKPGVLVTPKAHDLGGGKQWITLEPDLKAILSRPRAGSSVGSRPIKR